MKLSVKTDYSHCYKLRIKYFRPISQQLQAWRLLILIRQLLTLSHLAVSNVSKPRPDVVLTCVFMATGEYYKHLLQHVQQVSSSPIKHFVFQRCWNIVFLNFYPLSYSETFTDLCCLDLFTDCYPEASLSCLARNLETP